jgi:hypothetical protein
MPPTVPLSAPPLNWQDLPLSDSLNSAKFDKIKGYLDILMLALASLTPLETVDLHNSVQELQLKSLRIPSAVNVPLSHPQQWWSDTENISVEEARSLVVVICHLARRYQELLRRAVTLMEQMQEQGKDPAVTALLGEYLNNFQAVYSPYRSAEGQLAWQELQPFAFKLLIDLLFYSAINGHRRLWLVLLE